ncbi:MAG TPA: protein-disulfide reductase DsbD [Methylococcus sp.]|nr:protein-disulfide reductase DsbD [Methylococcus sp.]
MGDLFGDRVVIFLRLVLVAASLLAAPVRAIDPADLLPPERAFPLGVRMEGAATAVLSWDIAEGYYLYRHRFRFASPTPDVRPSEPVFPPGYKKQDEFFGEVETYRGHLEVRLPLVSQGPLPPQVDLDVTVQGCADAGVCFPPYRRTVSVNTGFSPPARSVVDSLNSLASAFQSIVGMKGMGDLLPADQAFRFFAEVQDPSTLRLHWQIADGYYLYREKFSVDLSEVEGIRLGSYEIPHGEPKQDEEFGPVEVFHRELSFTVPLIRTATETRTIRLEVGFQGCAERGVCYPPMRKAVELTLPEGGAISSPPREEFAGEQLAEQDRIANSLRNHSLVLNLVAFLGFGLLLAFTPCIFPMIPILSGLIVGHGHAITTWRAFWLSLTYVLAHALAYTIFGVLAGLFGANLQMAMQNPWAIGAFSGLFVLLALSMFDFYPLQLPTAWQSRFAALSSRQHGGSLAGAATMGFVSAFLVGPCVAAPLAGALIYIGQTGNAVLGGLALFALGFGMGLPLLVIGTSAGKLLPKAGVWMNAVKSVFGVGMLAVAIWMLERIVPVPVAMLLWALLLIVSAIYLGALDSLPVGVSGWRRLWKGLGVAMLAYGVFMLLGVAADNRDPLQPLRGLAGTSGPVANPSSPVFERVHSRTELEGKLAEAAQQGRWVLLDFYADWCVSCKEMERYTFGDAAVRNRLLQVMLLRADVTANTDEDQALLRRFELVGPPATLFFGPDRRERKQYRIVGYTDAKRFLAHLEGFQRCLVSSC